MPVEIRYLGTVDDGLRSAIFEARPAPGGTSDRPAFRIQCSDQRPVDGLLACQLDGYQQGGLSCSAQFAYSALGEERLQVPASCGGQSGRLLFLRAN